MSDTPRRPFEPAVEAEIARRVKRELRTSLQRTRAATPAAARAAAAEAIATRLVELGELGQRGEGPSGRAVALFRPIVRKGEVDTTPIDRAARAAGGRVAYPFLEDPPWDGAPFDPANPPPPPEMKFRWVDGPADAIDDAFEDRGHGFPEPRADLPLAAPDDFDVVIVPALAFDPRGHRIGYGAGFYDRFLAARRSLHAVGVCFDFQLVAEVPAGQLDVPVARVVTDRRSFAVDVGA